MHRIDKKGKAGTVLLIVAILIAIIVISMYVKLNWARFKAEARFGFAMAALVVFVLVITALIIRHKIRKAKKEKARKLEEERLERERINQERIEAGLEPLPEPTLGNGKFELSDISEAAEKVGEKVSGALKKDE